jgi:hypothetical protein
MVRMIEANYGKDRFYDESIIQINPAGKIA